jgi:hypothetical protein
MSIKIVKMINGEELIGDVVDTLDGKIVIKDPVTLGMVERNQLGFIGYMPHANLSEGITLEPSKVMFVVPVDPKLENEYQAAFGKVIIPKKGLTLTT